MIIPTPRFWMLVALGIPLALLGGVIPGLEKVVVPYNIALFFALFLSAWVAKRQGELRVVRRHDHALSVRVPNRVELTLEYEGHRPWIGRIREVPPESMHADQVEFEVAIAPFHSKVLVYHVIPSRRGLDQFGDVHARILAPFGLCEVQQILTASAPARTYPNLLALREFELLKQRGRLSLMGIRKSQIKGQGTEFESLREYHDDDYRKVDWKTTARKGKLVVRDYETERNQAVIVCLDAGRHMLAEVDGVPKIDLALDASLMLLEAARSYNDQTGLLVFSDRVQSYIPPKKGRAQIGLILDAIHDLEADPIESDYDTAMSYLSARWKRRSLIVFFTDSEDEEQATRLQRAIAGIVRRHLVMVVRVSDPRLKEIMNLTLTEDRDLFQRAAGLWYSTERKLAERRLALQGVQNIDAEPAELAQALVSAYIVAKETAAL